MGLPRDQIHAAALTLHAFWSSVDSLAKYDQSERPFWKVGRDSVSRLRLDRINELNQYCPKVNR